MPKLKIFTAPKDYSDYSFWRMWHQEKAILVIIGAAVSVLEKFAESSLDNFDGLSLDTKENRKSLSSTNSSK